MKQRIWLLLAVVVAMVPGIMWYRSSVALKAAHEVHRTLNKNVLIGAYQNLGELGSLPPEQAGEKLVNAVASLAQAEILSLAHEKAGGEPLLDPGTTGSPLAKINGARESLVRNGSLSESDLQFLRQARLEIETLLNGSLRRR